MTVVVGCDVLYTNFVNHHKFLSPFQFENTIPRLTSCLVVLDQNSMHTARLE